VRLAATVQQALTSAWQLSYCQQVASALSIAASRCSVLSVVAGSALVTTQIAADATAANTALSPAAAITELSSQAQDTSSTFVANVAAQNLGGVDVSYTPTVAQAVLCPNGATYAYSPSQCPSASPAQTIHLVCMNGACVMAVVMLLMLAI